MRKINYIEYGVGNFLSIKNSLESINIKLNIVDRPNKFDKDLHTLLPGVGNFDYCMKQLAKNNLVKFLKDQSNFKKNLIGICVGMQIMFKRSEESYNCSGLGIFEGDIVNLNRIGVKKTPIIGWNKIYGNFREEFINKKYYFIHSYGNISSKHSISFYKIGDIKINSIIKKNNFIGLQFHPEKSGQIGIDLLDEYFK